MNKFGAQIRKLREGKKLTLRSLAEQSGLSYSFIASLEIGRYNPSRKSIYSLANPLGADVNELLMLAGFLPEQSKVTNKQGFSLTNNKSIIHEPFALETIMEMPVTFHENKLEEADKIALISFLQKLSDHKTTE